MIVSHFLICWSFLIFSFADHYVPNESLYLFLLLYLDQWTGNLRQITINASEKKVRRSRNCWLFNCAREEGKLIQWERIHSILSLSLSFSFLSHSSHGNQAYVTNASLPHEFFNLSTTDGEESLPESKKERKKKEVKPMVSPVLKSDHIYYVTKNKFFAICCRLIFIIWGLICGVVFVSLEEVEKKIREGFL